MAERCPLGGDQGSGWYAPQAATTLEAGVPVVLLRQGKQFCAISATCPHAGGPLDEGTLTSDVVECPWHGSRFHLCDGRVLIGPAMVNAPRYDVRVRNG